MSEQNAPGDNLPPMRAAIAVAIGLLGGLAFVVLPYALVWLYAVATHRDPGQSLTSVAGFNLSLTVLFPFVQGLALGLAVGPRRYRAGVVAGLGMILWSIEVAVAAVILHEGIICIVILSPLVLGLIALGAWLGRMFALRGTARVAQVSLAPLFALAVFTEALGPPPDYVGGVTDAVIVSAPPEYVWRYVVSYPENDSPPDYWLWRIGLPYPVQSVADTPQIGAERVCRFSTGVVFDERIIELEPNRVLTFDVTRQPDHPEVIGHFQFDRGRIQLTENPDGTTTVTATSWYRLFVRPAIYFDWWTSDITRQVHFRVLNHIKALAEEDFRRDGAA